MVAAAGLVHQAVVVHPRQRDVSRPLEDVRQAVADPFGRDMIDPDVAGSRHTDGVATLLQRSIDVVKGNVAQHDAFSVTEIERNAAQMRPASEPDYRLVRAEMQCALVGRDRDRRVGAGYAIR